MCQIVSLSLMAQIECENYFGTHSDSVEVHTFHPLPGYDKPPVPLKGYEEFYKVIQKKIDEAGIVKKDMVLEHRKVLVEIVIDTFGDMACSRVERTVDSKLDSVALELIKGEKFIPAESKGKKVISVITIPIFFKSGKR